MADRDAAEDLARRPALHRPAPRGCREVWAPARQGRRGHHQDREELFRDHRDAANPAGPGGNLAAGHGDLTFIAGEGGQPLTKELFGNLFRAACRAGRRRRLGARSSQDRGDQGGGEWRDGRAARGYLWLEGREDGIALHRVRRSQAVGDRGYGQAGEP